MCGIIGIIGIEPVAGRLIEALRRLEYRGYDSAGVATLEHGAIARRRAEGKLGNLTAKLEREPLGGTIGIGHTRWATHGGPTENNAHPHITDRVAVVHNGIIENFRELLADLEPDGYLPKTQTDTEVVALLVTRELDRGKDPEEAVATTLKLLRGAFGLAFLFAGEEQLLIAARRGSPLAIGFGAAEMFLGSDAFALAPFTNSIAYLEEGDWAGPHPAPRRLWSRRAITATSWPRKSTSNPRPSRTRLRIMSTWPPRPSCSGRSCRSISRTCRG
jgi:glucosamine--fructose-6-phosphate aminotransferase (isomerizing)